MTETAERPEHSGATSEMDFGHIIRVLFRQKWLLLGVTVAASVAAAFYSLSKPNIYASSAALIVRPPQSALEQDPEAPPLLDELPSLSVETLQTLSESTETKWELFESLWDKQMIPEWTQEGMEKLSVFPGFEGSLSTELQRQQSRRAAAAVELLPILVLHARATDPEVAQIVANEWAAVVEKKSREIYTSGVEASGTFVAEMYDRSSTTLRDLEEELTRTTLEADLTLKEARLKTLAEKISLLEGEILDLEIEVGVNEIAISEGRNRVAGLEVDGEWIGTVAEDRLLRGEANPFEETALSEQARTVVALAAQKVAQKESIRAYRREQNLLTKEKQFTHLQADIERILLEKAKVEDELPALEGALAALNARLESIPERIVLNKAITDDALWDSYLEETEASPRASVPLKSESLNPVYQTTMQSAIEMSSKIETLRGSAAQLQASADRVNEKMNQLEAVIDLDKQEIDRRTITMEAIEGSLKLLHEDYLEEKNRVDELLVANMRKNEEREIRTAKRTEFEGTVRDIQEEVANYTLQIDQLTREVDTSKNVRTAIASRAEAAALLQVAAENASRTGTAIFYQARANANKVAPERLKVVLAGAMGAFLISTFLVCAWELARTPE